MSKRKNKRPALGPLFVYSARSLKKKDLFKFLAKSMLRIPSSKEEKVEDLFKVWDSGFDKTENIVILADRHDSRIWDLRKAVIQLENRIHEAYYAKKKLLNALNGANRDYELGRISYSKYADIWSSHLGKYSLEDVLSAYDTYIKTLASRKAAYALEIRETKRDKELANKALSISLSLILIFGIITGLTLFRTELRELVGFAIVQTTATTGEAIISTYYAIHLSNNSIEFGTLIHGSENNSAVLNNEAVGATGYYINVSNDSNVDVFINLSADSHLTNGSNVIGAGNMSWSCLNYSTAALPNIGNETAFTLTQVLTTSGFDVGAGENAYYRFWIDIPLGQTPGQYSNNITFTGYRAS